MTLTPLGFNLTRRDVLETMRPWLFRLDQAELAVDPHRPRMRRPVVSMIRRRQTVDENETNG